MNPVSFESRGSLFPAILTCEGPWSATSRGMKSMLPAFICGLLFGWAFFGRSGAGSSELSVSESTQAVEQHGLELPGALGGAEAEGEGGNCRSC